METVFVTFTFFTFTCIPVFDTSFTCLATPMITMPVTITLTTFLPITVPTFTAHILVPVKLVRVQTMILTLTNLTFLPAILTFFASFTTPMCTMADTTTLTTFLALLTYTVTTHIGM